MTGRRLRVLHAPWDVGGHPSTLAAAERTLGLDSRCYTLSPSPFGYEGARSLTRAGRSPVVVEAARLRLLELALRWADVVHLNFGSAILPADVAATPTHDAHSLGGRVARSTYRWLRRTGSGFDLALLRRVGKPIVVTFQGDDARPTVGHPAGLQPDPDLDRRRMRLIEQFDRSATSLLALNPDLLQVLPDRAEFFPYANVDVRRVQCKPLPPGPALRVAHAPTSRGVKGTDVVIEAVTMLQREGIGIELDLIEGVANSEVLRRLGDAHVVVDQLRIGWYGGLAVEAMALGRPVIAFIDSVHRDRLPERLWAELPVWRANSTTLAEALRTYSDQDPTSMAGHAAKARSFVEEWHDPHVLAERMIDIYQRALRK